MAPILLFEEDNAMKPNLWFTRINDHFEGLEKLGWAERWWKLFLAFSIGLLLVGGIGAGLAHITEHSDRGFLLLYFYGTILGLTFVPLGLVTSTLCVILFMIDYRSRLGQRIWSALTWF